jgi:hypothetical protein
MSHSDFEHRMSVWPDSRDTRRQTFWPGSSRKLRIHRQCLGIATKLRNVKSRIDDEDGEFDQKFDEDEADHNKNLKRALIAVSLVAGLAIVLAGVLFFGGNNSSAQSAATSTREAPAVPSAQDTGPVAVITDDPSCVAWTAINNSLSNDGLGIWNERDRSVPASAWDDKQRVQFVAAAQSMRNAATQAVGLAKLTPHRVMRELYEQFIAYAHSYVEHVPKYVPADDNLAGTANSVASALGAMCTAITDGSAAARGPMVPPGAPPSQIPPMGSPANPHQFLASPNGVCAQWKSALDQFGQQTAAWQSINPSIPAILWTEEQRAANYDAAKVMNTFADNLVHMGSSSGNFIWQDFADLAAQYRRAFAVAVPTYTPPDNHLANAANYLSTTVLGACAVVQGE